MAKVGRALSEVAAHTQKGTLRATAASEGAMTEKGTIDKGWIAKKAHGKGKTARRARLAQTYAKHRGGGKG